MMTSTAESMAVSRYFDNPVAAPFARTLGSAFVILVGVTPLNPAAAFLHVVDAHRWLAASGCAWNLVGANATNETKDQARELLPNVDVMVRDCLLLHARSLIKFYRNVGRETDIVLSHFKIAPIAMTLSNVLEGYEKPIEVHLLHLTHWRDTDYRNSSVKGGAARGRQDWDSHSSLIVETLIKCLKHASIQAGPWNRPFADLYAASARRYREKAYDWPRHLSEKPDLEQYLKDVGL
jgi:hypothetical protein